MTNEEEIVQRRIFEEKIHQLESTIEEKDVKINDLVHRVNEVEAKFDTLENCFGQKTSVLEETFENQQNFFIEKLAKFEKIDYLADSLKSMERKVYFLEKTNLGVEFCEFVILIYYFR